MHTRHTTHRRTLVTLAVIAAALAGCSDANSGDTASTGRAGDATSASAPTSAGATSATTLPSGAQKVGEIAEGGLTPGRYALPPVGPGKKPFAVVDIPDGYATWGPFIYASKPAEPEDPLAIGLWVVTGVYLNPCAESNEVPTTSVGAIVDALVRQRLTSAARLREVDLAEYRGKYVEVTTPTDRDYARCDDAELNLWEGRPEGGYWTREPGMVERLWILDVDGQPMVIQMAVPPSATDPQIHALTHIVEAATFETPDA